MALEVGHSCVTKRESRHHSRSSGREDSGDRHRVREGTTATAVTSGEVQLGRALSAQGMCCTLDGRKRPCRGMQLVLEGGGAGGEDSGLESLVRRAGKAQLGQAAREGVSRGEGEQPVADAAA